MYEYVAHRTSSYTAHSTPPYSVQCTVYSVQCTVYRTRQQWIESDSFSPLLSTCLSLRTIPSPLLSTCLMYLPFPHHRVREDLEGRADLLEALTPRIAQRVLVRVVLARLPPVAFLQRLRIRVTGHTEEGVE